MNRLFLYFGLAICVVAAGGCKRKAPEKAADIPPAAMKEVAGQGEAKAEPTVVGEHLTAQALTEDLVLYTLQIEFDPDQAVIRQAYFADLDKIGKALTRDPQATARIEGHADRRNTSTPEYNLQLSRSRAMAVAEYLQSKSGIATNRLTTAGFGFDRPLESNDPVNGSSRNRRVEVYINQSPAAPEVPAPADTNRPALDVGTMPEGSTP